VNCGANQQVCLKGKCGICPTGQTDCTGVCRNLSTDPDNCGACDNKCPAEHICCSAVCRNLQTDANNCGACGNKCTGVKNCVKGSCACPSGQSDCSNICVNLINDVDNCGACGNKCAGGKSCVNGKCDCPSGQSDCSGTCANINIDANNCGACGNKCTGGETCCSGVCLNLQTDFNNCGACGNKCTGGKSCVNGKCACPTGQSDCSGICRNLHTDDNNCGICVNKCASSQSCTIGKCLYPLEVYISSGSFTMSSPLGELGRADVRENPQRMVHITRSFVIGKYEVTQGEFESLMGYNPLYFKNCGANCPVEQVNWHEALAYLNALSRNRGLEECFDCTGSGSSVSCSVKTQYSGQNYYNCKGYRLPTEAEWEYAYRVGTNTAFYNGAITQTGCNPLDPNLDKIGWYCGNSGSKTHPVGGKQANAWGLYDMAGNVREWVYDRYQDSYNNLPTTDPVGPSTGSIRVFRGGSYASYALICRAAFRDGSTPTSRTRDLGLRFLRSI
jgi:formylglycine-generating enzyme required for sulfatase activity